MTTSNTGTFVYVKKTQLRLFQVMYEAEKLRNVQFFEFRANFGPGRVFEHNLKTNSMTPTFFLLNLQLFDPVLGIYSQMCWEKSE